MKLEDQVEKVHKGSDSKRLIKHREQQAGSGRFDRSHVALRREHNAQVKLESADQLHIKRGERQQDMEETVGWFKPAGRACLHGGIR